MTNVVFSNNSVISVQSESVSGQMATESIGGKGGGISISSLSEWIGIFSIGMMAGFLSFKTNDSNYVKTVIRKGIVFSIAILSLAVGTIHLLLIQEHTQESLWWGIIFLISGIGHIGFGLIIVFVKRYQFNIMLNYIGVIGNALLVTTFILVRLFIPSFSPEGTPVNELEPNGIITLVIEIIIVILLIYLVKFKEESKKIMK